MCCSLFWAVREAKNRSDNETRISLLEWRRKIKRMGTGKIIIECRGGETVVLSAATMSSLVQSPPRLQLQATS